jgi:hypothetical protein
MHTYSTVSIREKRQKQKKHLVPPSLGVGTEIKLGPGRKENLAGFGIHIAVRQGEGKRGGSTHDGTGRSVLGSVARALELVGGSGPRDDATKMGAHGVQTVALNGLVILDDNVAVRQERSEEKRR